MKPAEEAEEKAGTEYEEAVEKAVGETDRITEKLLLAALKPDTVKVGVR